MWTKIVTSFVAVLIAVVAALSATVVAPAAASPPAHDLPVTWDLGESLPAMLKTVVAPGWSPPGPMTIPVERIVIIRIR